MKTQEITIAGKKVTLAYCYATEISYKVNAEEDISDFMTECVAAIQAEPQRLPDVRKSVWLIVAAALAYSEATGKDCPVKDTDIMYHATPEELGTALGTIIVLRAQFYGAPKDEAEAAKEEGDPKNA